MITRNSFISFFSVIILIAAVSCDSEPQIPEFGTQKTELKTRADIDPVDPNTPEPMPEPMTVSYFDTYGSAHNNMMTAMLTGFTIPSSCQLPTAFFSYIDSLQCVRAQNIINDSEFLNYYTAHISEVHDYYITEYIYEDNFSDGGIGMEPPLRTNLNTLKNNNVIKDTEAAILNRMYTLLDDGLAGELTDQAFISELNTIVDQYENQKYLSDGYEGKLAGPTINIAKHSLTYWENPNNKSLTSDPIAQVVAADATGALAGGIWSILGQRYIGGSSSINWKHVGYFSAMGAIAGSMGPVAVLCSALTLWLHDGPYY